MRTARKSRGRRLGTLCMAAAALLAAAATSGCGRGNSTLLSMRGVGGDEKTAITSLPAGAYATYSYDCSSLQYGGWTEGVSAPQGYFGVDATALPHGRKVMLFSSRDAGGRSVQRPLSEPAGKYRVHVMSNCSWHLSIKPGPAQRS